MILLQGKARLHTDWRSARFVHFPSLDALNIAEAHDTTVAQVTKDLMLHHSVVDLLHLDHEVFVYR